MRLVGGGDWSERLRFALYVCSCSIVGKPVLRAGEFSLALFILTTREASARAPGWLRLWRAVGAGNGWDCRPPVVPLPKPCFFHPRCLVNTIAVEGTSFAAEATLSRLLNSHVPALRRALENRERWQEFGRGAEKRWGRCLWGELGHGAGQAWVPLWWGIRGTPCGRSPAPPQPPKENRQILRWNCLNLERSTKWCSLWYWKPVKREVALKSLEHLWEGWRTKKITRTYRLVCSGVLARSRRKHEDFRGQVGPWGSALGQELCVTQGCSWS